jgi:hypothetical protein
MTYDEGPEASNSDLSVESDDDMVMPDTASVLKCALAHIKACKRSVLNSEAPDSIKRMVACWEQHKNEKNKNTLEYASTCYHQTEDQGTECRGYGDSNGYFGSDVPSAKRHSVMIDTGANLTLMQSETEQFLTDSQDSRVKIEVADGRYVRGGKDGTVHMHILELQRGSHKSATRNMTDTGITMALKVTTIENLTRQLFSVDDMYLNGCSILLRAPGYGTGVPEIHVPATEQHEAYDIPLRYDYKEGGFWLDYYLHDPKDSSGTNAKEAVRWRLSQEAEGNAPSYECQEAAFMVKALQECEAVTQIELVHETEELICQPCYANPVQGVEFNQHPDAGKTNIRGVKMGLKSAKRQMSASDFHNDHGHLGCVGKCIICTLARGCARSITHIVDRYIEVRRAHTWDGDILTWEHRSELKNKYEITLRDRMSKAVKFLYIKNRNDSLEAIKGWITEERAKPEFQDMGYEFASLLCLDRAGEWGEESHDWKELTIDLKFETMWTSPDNKKEASRAERTVGIAEVTQKAFLLQRSLHHSWWQVCGDAAEFLLNRFPSTRTDKTMPIDGDQARPIEILTGGKHSRRQCDREISYFVAPGTPALVHDTMAKGSQLDTLKSSWKVAKGMYREQVRWWSPWTRQCSHSKSYTAFKLQEGISFIDFLGLKGLPRAAREESIQCDFDKEITIKLPELPRQLVERAKKAAASTQPLIAVKHAIEQLEGENGAAVQYTMPTVTVKDTTNELGGSVHVLDQDDQVLTADPESGVLRVQEHFAQIPKKPSSTKSHGKASHVDIEQSAELNKLWDDAEAAAVKGQAHITGTEDRFVRVCKSVFKMPHHQHVLYRQWLLENVRLPDGRAIQEEDLPMERGMCMPPGMRLPLPTGQAWRELKSPSELKEAAIDQINGELLAMAVRGVQQEIRALDPIQFKKGRVSFAKSSQMPEAERRVAMSIKNVNKEYREIKRAFQAKARRQKAVATDTIPEPRTTREALERDPDGWSKSIRDEIDPLIEMGVLDEGPGGTGFSKRELLAEGIDINIKKAVGLGLYHTHKFDKEGEIDRLKTRGALQGHKGNMQRGNHFTETFTPTPKEDTARLLVALMCLYNLVRMTGDVVKAYCWAPMPPGSLIAVKYPQGLKKYDPLTREELYMVLRKNLYGHPAAGRAWGQLRDSEILKHFNVQGWTCTQCEMDPCLFYFKRDGEWALVSIHTDDMDAVGTNNEILEGIFNKVNDIWELKRTDPELMLGVCRKVSLDGQGKVTSCDQTMEAYIKGMAEAFREHLPQKAVQSFLPPKTNLSKYDKPPDLEIQECQAKGYNRAVGMIVWAVRHVAPIGKYGVTQLCTVMATPSRAAFEAAMNAIAFLEQRAKKGIKFSASGNRIPVFMVDASNKPDPNDGKCHAGFTGHLANGPLIAKSFKLKHCGLSSEQNEYMGLTACLRAVVWLRQLLGEIERHDMIREPTVVYGDNIQANRLCKEHFVTSGNQHILMPYHWNREVIEAKMAAIHWVQTTHNISDLMSKNTNSAISKQLDGLLSGYEDIAGLIKQLESSPRLHTEDNHKLGGVSR